MTSTENNQNEEGKQNLIELRGNFYNLIHEETQEKIGNSGNKETIIIKYMEKNNKTYDYYKKAHDNYVQKNKDKINEKRRTKYSERYANDEEFREMIKAKNRENYAKKKLNKK